MSPRAARSSPTRRTSPPTGRSRRSKSGPTASRCRGSRKPVTKRRQTYEADGITVTFDPDVCIHSGVGVRGLPDVFDIKRKRWIRPELQPPEAVAAQAMESPAGALPFVRTTGAMHNHAGEG